MYRRNDSTSWVTVVFLILVLIVVAFVSRSCSADRYNYGICKLCGGHYVYQQAVGHRYTTGYIYRCDKCGQSIEVNKVYPEAGNE